MRLRIAYILSLIAIVSALKAQQVEVEYDYSAEGDCIFSAHNNSKSPVFLHLNFADLQNTTFEEELPYVKRLTPGFNPLFTLYRDLGSDVPKFNYEIKIFRSNPMAQVDLSFPYLIPFAENTKIRVFDVENIEGFKGAKKLESWSATGFEVKAGTPVFAARNGVVVELVGNSRTKNTETWYNGWKNTVTLIQPDGTLICYKNLIDRTKKLKVGGKVYAGESIGEVAPSANSLEVLIYHHSLNTKGLMFVIPQFITTNTGKIDFVNSATEYIVSHPKAIRALEMTKRERRKLLKKK